jgi:hypothetical protein
MQSSPPPVPSGVLIPSLSVWVQGHHAGSRGVVTDDPAQGSHGFCLINNVAVAAAYARTMYRHKGIARIAIVDFDVHHGNGKHPHPKRPMGSGILTFTLGCQILDLPRSLPSPLP